jgi:spore cortex biosynthesis protein YabQ
MWEIDIGEQLLFFGRSIILGIIYCFFYDFLRAIRRTVKISDISVAIQDIIFFIIISPVTFLYLLAATNGELRFYIFLGIFLGFISCFYTISRVWVTVLSRCFSVIYKVINKIFSIIHTFFSKEIHILRKYFKKTVNFFKNNKKAEFLSKSVATDSTPRFGGALCAI